MEENKKPTIGTAEAAEIFGCNAATISRWCRERKFPKSYQKEPGHPWHIPISDIDVMKKKKGLL